MNQSADDPGGAPDSQAHFPPPRPYCHVRASYLFLVRILLVAPCRLFGFAVATSLGLVCYHARRSGAPP